MFSIVTDLNIFASGERDSTYFLLSAYLLKRSLIRRNSYSVCETVYVMHIYLDDVGHMVKTGRIEKIKIYCECHNGEVLSLFAILFHPEKNRIPKYSASRNEINSKTISETTRKVTRY